MPEQKAHKSKDGLFVTVDGEALFRVNQAMYERGEILAAQIHSHPTTAFHSDTDDCFSLVTLRGALSVVVPDFGARGLDAIEDWAWLRLTGLATWRPLAPPDQVVVVSEPDDQGGE